LPRAISIQRAVGQRHAILFKQCARADGNLYMAILRARPGVGIQQERHSHWSNITVRRENGRSLASTSLAIRHGAHDLYVVTNDGTAGQRATVFHSTAFGRGLPVFNTLIHKQARDTALESSPNSGKPSRVSNRARMFDCARKGTRSEIDGCPENCRTNRCDTAGASDIKQLASEHRALRASVFRLWAESCQPDDCYSQSGGLVVHKIGCDKYLVPL
jgi:hypothetical protein